MDKKEIVNIPISSIFLDLENPRHEPYQSEEEVIDYLCKNEYIYSLAQDIVKIGINPLEVFAVIPNSDFSNNITTYIIAEGNRRLCALKLLADPELAPSEERGNFRILSRLWNKSEFVSAIVFQDRESVAQWLERIHGGLQGGIGRKPWSAEQKTRFTGDIKNLMSQQLLDYAQKKGFISAEERSNKISTVQRFITNPLFKDALGLDTSKTDELQRTRPEADFNLILAKFIFDLKSGTINTRFNSPEIKKYSNELRKVDATKTILSSPESLNIDEKSSTSSSSTQKPKPLAKPHYLQNSEKTEEALTKLGNYKLSSIYNSLHRLNVASHCPLLTVGLWSFIESLTALNGRNFATDFQAFLTPVRLEELGLGPKAETKAIRECLKRLADNGNTTKHDKTSAAFNDQQLFNDFEVLHPLFQALAGSAKSE